MVESQKCFKAHFEAPFLHVYRSVIDFRDYKGEYKRHDGPKLLDVVGTEVMDVSKAHRYKRAVWVKNHEPLNTEEVRHCMIDMFGKIFVINLLLTNILSLWKVSFIALSLLLKDFIGRGQFYLKTNTHTLVSETNQNDLNYFHECF